MPKDAGFCPSAVATTTPIKSDKSCCPGWNTERHRSCIFLIRPLHACLTASQTLCRIFYPGFQVGNISYHRLDPNKGARGYSGWVTGTLVEHQGEGIAPNQRNRSECKSLLVYWRSLCSEHCIYLFTYFKSAITGGLVDAMQMDASGSPSTSSCCVFHGNHPYCFEEEYRALGTDWELYSNAWVCNLSLLPQDLRFSMYVW